MKTLSITSDMVVYSNMPVNETYHDTVTHIEEIREAIELFLNETVEPETGSRVKVNTLKDMFYRYWHNMTRDNEELNQLPESTLNIVFSRYIMNYLSWVNLHSRMWLAHYRFIPTNQKTIAS